MTAITLILLAFGTNYLNYSGIGGAHTHNWLFTIYALLIHFSIRWHRKPSYLDSIAIGVCVGLAALTRPTDIISFLIPLLWGFTTYADDSSSSRINGNAVLAAGREWLKNNTNTLEKARLNYDCNCIVREHSINLLEICWRRLDRV